MAASWVGARKSKISVPSCKHKNRCTLKSGEPAERCEEPSLVLHEGQLQVACSMLQE